MKIHPALAAIANVLLPGAGYILIRKRVVFGYLLLAASIVSFIQLVIDPSINIYGTTPVSVALGWVTFISATLAFGYDAYTLAKEPMSEKLTRR